MDNNNSCCYPKKKLNIKIQIYFLSSCHCYQNSFFLIMSPKYASSGQVIELNNTSLRRRVTYSKEAFEALLYIVVSSSNLDIVPQNIYSFPLEILTKHI